jgi:hypothetical protein
MQEHQGIPGLVCVVHQEKRAAASADVLRTNLKFPGSPGVIAGETLIPDGERKMRFVLNKAFTSSSFPSQCRTIKWTIFIA